MRRNRAACRLALAVLLFTPGSLSADLSAGFDVPDIVMEAFLDGQPFISTIPPGNPGGYLVLTDEDLSRNNWVSFPRTTPGASNMVTFSFDFLMTNPSGLPGPDNTSADGFSFSFADTAMYGTTAGVGVPLFTPEDPAALGILGFGFDTWSNSQTGTFDGPPVGGVASDYQEISLFWDGVLVSRIDDTRQLAPPLEIDDGAWHHATGTIDFLGGTVDLTIDGGIVFDAVAVPRLEPFENRLILAGRTAGQFQLAGIDNIDVQYAPEPAVAPGLVFGASVLAAGANRRRRARAKRLGSEPVTPPGC